MPAIKQMTLPITGMYCANCVSTIERNLKKVSGVQSAVVNLASERAVVQFDPEQASLTDMVGRIERAGYGVAAGTANIPLKRLADNTDGRRLEQALSARAGTIDVQVSVATEAPRIK